MINIYGKGGHAKVVHAVIKQNEAAASIRFWSDVDFNNGIQGKWVVAIGDNLDRMKVVGLLGSVEFITVISNTAIVSNCKISEGSQLLQGCVVQTGTVIGKHCILNTAASVDHDCILNDFSFIGPNATLCGGVNIGAGSFVGAGAVILPNITIGKNVIVGAVAVVTKNIHDDVVITGNPARQL